MNAFSPPPAERILNARDSAGITPPRDRGVVSSQTDLNAQGSHQNPAREQVVRVEGLRSPDGRALAREGALAPVGRSVLNRPTMPLPKK